MAQYKVPQDVEADDKLLGPFSFRQFVYLMVAAGLCFVAFLLFQIFPLLVIIPIPFIFFLGILALPLKKDQPMETYLSAVVDFYLKPQKRIWMPGQSDTTITITAPKNVEENRTKDISQEEASHRLSFLANIVDTEGYAIKDTNSNLRDDIASEAAQTQDIFEVNQNYTLDHSLEQSTAAHHAQLVEQMRTAINQNSIYGAAAPQSTPQIQHQTPQVPTQQTPIAQPQPTAQPAQSFVAPQIAQFQPPVAPVAQPVAPTITPAFQPQPVVQQPNPAAPVDVASSSATIQPDIEEIHEALTLVKDEPEPQENNAEETISVPEPKPEPAPTPPPAPAAPAAADPELQNLANNSDFSIETIAKQAKRIKEKQQSNDNEVYISLH